MIKYVKHVELDISPETVFLNTQILYEYMDDWENVMKHLYLKNKIFTVT